jgi:hypothetical protein
MIDLLYFTAMGVLCHTGIALVDLLVELAAINERPM